ncbi:hypothetical protein VitviT2T_008568 [Vitis vinifera]|uniref:Malectin domain-containing protein n=1 Tax=Vitis vinifera TaxID=29760 RepID=A0ABY9C2B4_VITVI|nr:hypothetical protein VitviT2T_008568 [Vitis vinifera]
MPNSDCKLFYPSLYLLEFLRINIDENIGRPMLPSIPNENAYLNRVVKPIYDLCIEVEGSIMGTTISIEKNNGIKRPCECTIAHDISLENVSRMHELSEAFHAISLRHTCLMSILEQFSKLSSRAGDLSFNKLNGEIPNLDGLTNVEVMCLTGNRLNGNIPDGIKGRQSRTNLFRSFSEEGNLELGGCLENYPCQKDRYSLHINCGGEKSIVGNVVYEGDQYEGGAAKFHPMTDYWGFSSTGHFWDHNRTINDYTAQNVSVLGMNHSGLYTRARLSPLSFTYYGRCLADGNYTVLMHDFIIRYNVMAPTLGLVSYLPILETYFISNLASVRSLQLELKSLIEEFEKLDKFHMEQMEEEVTARNAHMHQQKVGSLECFMVAKSSVEEFSKTDIVEGNIMVLMHDFIIRYNVMAPTLGLVSYLPILETYFINNLARVRSLQLELKSLIEEFEKLDKFHMEQMEEEVAARNAHIHQQKVGSLECFMVAKSSAEEFSKTDIVEAWTH